MKKTLVLFAHPALEQSRANSALLERICDLDHVTIHDLYAEYPDFLINVDKEQALLEEHDRIVLQHPFFWYSSPAILKEWFDLVLEYGWAYGEEGQALEGKTVLTALTTGGGKTAYCSEGHNVYAIEEFLRPMEQTARLCHMKYEKPFVVYGSLALTAEELAEAASEYREILSTDPRIDGV
ncbi:MAG: NAD(P)H-dependent oxidoreductase [Verrucomicrobiota bacterium]